MKKLSLFLCVMLISICCFCFIPACGIYYDISSVEELYAMQSNKSYRLTSDMDLQEREWYPLKVENFDGNGYTIKNCFINDIINNSDDRNKGFFARIDKVENVTFENIQCNISVSASDYCSIGLVAGSLGSANSVIVKNCSLLVLENLDTSHFLNVGIIGGISSNATKCTIENSQLECNISKYCENYVGGMVGRISGKSVSDCKIDNLNIEIDSKSNSDIGLIIGMVDCQNLNIKNCVAKNSKISSVNKSEYTSRAGGIVGYVKLYNQFNDQNTQIEQCISINNQIKIDSEGGYNIGGIVGKNAGKTRNCLSDSNGLIGTTQSTLSNQYAGVGGLCGSNSGTISKCISQNNDVTGTSKTNSNRMLSAGFVAEAEASVVDCAVYDNKVNGGYTDVFTAILGLTHNCYVVDAGQTTPNKNNIELLEVDKVKGLFDLLSLDNAVWSIDSFGRITLNLI